MVAYTQKHFPEELWEQHKKMCTQYKNATSMAEAETLYHALRAWWASTGVVGESGLIKLDQWLSFWHHRFRQWGGFMTEVFSLHSVLMFLILVSYSKSTKL
jgi:hypothetical protein